MLIQLLYQFAKNIGRYTPAYSNTNSNNYSSATSPLETITEENNLVVFSKRTDKKAYTRDRKKPGEKRAKKREAKQFYDNLNNKPEKNKESSNNDF